MRNNQRHSRYGIFSLLTFLILLLFSAYIFYSDWMSISASNGGINPNNRIVSYIQTCIVFGISILGTVFAVLGVCERGKRKLFAIIGLFLNGLIAAGFTIATFSIFLI